MVGTMLGRDDLCFPLPVVWPFSGTATIPTTSCRSLRGEAIATDEGKEGMKRHGFEMTLGAVLLGVFLRFWSWLTPRKELRSTAT